MNFILSTTSPRFVCCVSILIFLMIFSNFLCISFGPTGCLWVCYLISTYIWGFWFPSSLDFFFILLIIEKILWIVSIFLNLISDPSCDLSWKNASYIFKKNIYSVLVGWTHEQYEKAKRKGTERWTPQVVGAQYATGDQWRNNCRKNEGMEPKQKQHPVVDVAGDGSKVRCCKEWYCIGTWNVRSMNQGKLEVVKQEMVRVNINILGISELKWTGIGEFNSDDHYIYYCG